MKCALLGFGTVGVGVYEILSKAKNLEPGPVLVREGKQDAPYKVCDIRAILDDPTVDVVIEAMGGTDPAYSYLKQAIESGKHVVSSNKMLVAAHGIELGRLAREHKVAFLFSAACGGAVPFLYNLSLATKGDVIHSVGGILNGTTNYMLDAMQRRKLDYADALKDAQELGYAEKDPTADVSGLDALRKIMLADAVAFSKLPSGGFCMEGIESITAADVEHFQGWGRTCRLLTYGGVNKDSSVAAYIEPVLFPSSAPECSVLNNGNMAKYDARYAGKIVLMGQGAGRYPTASAVIRDCESILEGKYDMMPENTVEVTADNSSCVHPYYLRCIKSCEAMFEFIKIEKTEDDVIGITKPMAVTKMHECARQIRESGGKIFFAAYED